MSIEIIQRPIYLDKAKRLLDKGMMLFITGQRRVGKSFLLLQIKEMIENSNPEANVLFIDKSELTNANISDYLSLYQHIKDYFVGKEKNYLLIDEVQEIEGFEYALRSLYSENICQIVATGSNAKILSTELSTLIGGRYFEVKVRSLDYEEFLSFHNLPDNDQSLVSYLTYGGLPGLRRVGLEDEESVRDYLESVYNAIVLKDIIAREKVRNVRFLEKLIRYTADNIGKNISLRNISNYCTKDKVEVTPPTVASYLKFMSNSYIVQELEKYDIHGKEILNQAATFYFQDLGLCNYLVGFRLANHIEKIIENAIWHHLMVRGFKVSVGVLHAGEIDFVATRKDERIYVQATYVLGSEDTIKREFGNLSQIRDNYPKYVVSMDSICGGRDQYPGIKHVHLRDFLKMKL